MKIILPFQTPDKYPITQKFGVKYLYQGKIATHKGVDFGLPKLTRLISPVDGIVKRITPERTSGYGKAVYIETRHKNGAIYIFLLAHLNEITVKEGWKLKAGQSVGYSGRSGFWRGVNGYHLHFGISVSGHFVDPLPLLKHIDPDELNLFNKDDDSLKVFHGNHVVVEGDSLWKIAEKFYGNGGHFMEIYLVNEDQLKNPHLIYPGQVLKIPVLKNKGI